MLPSQIKEAQDLFFQKYGIDLSLAEQGSEAWQNAKLGVLSASNAGKILAKADSDTRASYMSELVGQVATGIFEEISAKPMEWGKQHEDAARASYEFATGFEVYKMSFAFKDNAHRVGASVDGLVPAVKRGQEIKCPYNTKNYIDFLCAGKIKPDWNKQCNMSMWVMGVDGWDMVQYDPRMKKKPFHIVTIERDEKIIKTLEDAVPQFIHDMDKMLEMIGIKFGEQWERLVDHTKKEVVNA